MPIAVSCQCGRRFAAKDELRGKTVACPACKRPLTIQAGPAAAAARPQAPAAKPAPTAARPAAAVQKPAIVACRCGQRFQAAPHLFGKTVNCPSCRSPLKIPVPGARQPAPAPAPAPDPLANVFSATAVDDDPFGIGLANTAATLPSMPMQYGNYGNYAPTSVAAPVAKKKKAGGKGTKFWALTGSGVVTAFIVAVIAFRVVGFVVRAGNLAGLNFAAASGPVEWVPYNSAVGPYSCEIIKATPGVVIPEFVGRIGAGGTATAVSRAGPATIVNAERLPGRLGPNEQIAALGAVEAEITRGMAAHQGRVTQSFACNWGGRSARQINFESTGFNKEKAYLRVTIDESHFYMGCYLATQANFKDADAERFFNSFRLGGSGAAMAPPGVTTTTAPKVNNEDYALARKSFRTKLTRHIPAQATGVGPVVCPLTADIVPYRSAGRTLQAVASEPVLDQRKRPGLLYLHGGFAYGVEDWDQIEAFRNAGFVVMIPVLRGENRQPGDYTLFYDEVEDALAAAEELAKHPDVDPNKLFVAGHSAGGILAAQAAQITNRFKASAVFSAVLDMRLVKDDPDFQIVFDANDENEWRMRSVADFPTSFKCPTRLFYGDQEFGYETFTNVTALAAKAAGLDVEATRVPGDHMSMLDSAIPQSIAFFRQHM